MIKSPSELIESALQARGWDSGDLRRALADRGVNVTHQAISLWRGGGGMKDEHRSIVAEVLGLDPAGFALAFSARVQQSVSL